MELNERDNDWQKNAPNLAAAGKGSPFMVPAGYFEDLSRGLQTRVLIESMRFENTEEFFVPENYFEQLSDRINDRISLENIRTQSDSDGFTVPDAYFAGLADRINSRLEEQPLQVKKGRVRNLFNSWVGYSAAACIMLITASVIYLNSTSYLLGHELSGIPDQEIINYLQVHSTAYDTPYIIENVNTEGLNQLSSDISEDELEQYINNTTL